MAIESLQNAKTVRLSMISMDFGVNFLDFLYSLQEPNELFVLWLHEWLFCNKTYNAHVAVFVPLAASNLRNVIKDGFVVAFLFYFSTLYK